MSSQALRVYRRVSVESTPPARILDLLLGQLEKDIAEAKSAILEKDIKKKNIALGNAIAILAELTSALDRKSAPELTENLANLYAFMNTRIVEANARLETQPLDEIAPIVASIHEAFSEASRQQGR